MHDRRVEATRGHSGYITRNLCRRLHYYSSSFGAVPGAWKFFPIVIVKFAPIIKHGRPTGGSLAGVAWIVSEPSGEFRESWCLLRELFHEQRDAASTHCVGSVAKAFPGPLDTVWARVNCDPKGNDWRQV